MKESHQGRDVYFEFAWVYDQALGRRFFRAAAPLLDRLLDRYPTDTKTHLDVACGTGLAVAHMRDRGWTSAGLDGSLAMLRVARRRTSRLVAADFRAIPFRSSFSRITCLYDSFNHLLEPHDLLQTFQAVASIMREDSLFIFDVNQPAVYPRIWGLREPYISAGADYRLVMHTRYTAATELGVADLSGWAKVGGRRVGISERHRQRAWSAEHIETALRRASLEIVERIDFDPFDENGENGPGVKWVYVVKTVAGSG